MEWMVLEDRLRAARVMIRGEKIHKVIIWFLRKVNSKSALHDWNIHNSYIYLVPIHKKIEPRTPSNCNGGVEKKGAK
jgi:hypothetical protein